MASRSSWKNVSAAMDVEIKIVDLRLVVGRILDHIEYDLGHTVVKLDQDD